MVLTRLPLTTTSRRRFGAAVPPPPDAAGAAADAANMLQLVNAMPPGIVAAPWS